MPVAPMYSAEFTCASEKSGRRGKIFLSAPKRSSIHANGKSGSALIKSACCKAAFFRAAALQIKKLTSRYVQYGFAQFLLCALLPEKTQLFADGVLMKSEPRAFQCYLL